jgi:hypothetical protein
MFSLPLVVLIAATSIETGDNRLKKMLIHFLPAPGHFTHVDGRDQTQQRCASIIAKIHTDLKRCSSILKKAQL